MSGYWLYTRSEGRSKIINEPKPGWWVRFVCWVLLGWKWAENGTEDKQ